ncbi:unnamed protein product [Lymnaea stagnalis]|uniref:Antistasin-like domain-containing protein n=1 Tax=Lymnaea stagnalis TaxID=6523 RepID=A0AAV2IJ12_LYMST
MKLILASLLIVFTLVAASPLLQHECPMVKCVACPAGYEVNEDGCQTCTCKEVNRAVCSGVMCLMFCENGFAVGADGCEICRCA